jgi:hypothetical protein
VLHKFICISDIVKMAEGGITGEGPDSHIIAGVIDGMRQSFIDSGVDLDVLAKLENLWVSKLCSSSSAGLAMADVMVPGSKARKKGLGNSELSFLTS